MFSNYQLIILGVIFLCIIYLAFYGSSATSIKEGMSVADECAAKCKAAGYCCNDDQSSANQYLSCAQGCYMASNMDTAQCENVCSAQESARGCSYNFNDGKAGAGQWRNLCGVCSDYDPNNPKCAFSGGGTGGNCSAGCKIGSPKPSPPIELGNNSGWDFYKVPINGLATDANILSACAGAGMVTPCAGVGGYADANCTQTSEQGLPGGGNPMSTTSQALYGKQPNVVPEFNGVYNYMGGGWGGNSGCGTENGSWCSTGSNYSNRYAFCARQGKVPNPTPPAQFTCADAESCKAGYSPKSPNTQCGTDCLDEKCGCKCYLTNGQVEGQERCLPLNSNTGAGRWPNTSASGYNANMNCGTCLPRSSKASCNALSEHCYWGIPSAKPIANSCSYAPGGDGMFACGTDKCCNKDPTCSSMIGQCPPNQHVPKNKEGFNSMKEGFTTFTGPGGGKCYRLANGEVWCGSPGDGTSGEKQCGYPDGYSGTYYGLDAAVSKELWPGMQYTGPRDCMSNYFQSGGTTGTPISPAERCTTGTDPSPSYGNPWARTGLSNISRCTNLESGGGVCGGPTCTSGECCVDNLKCETYSDTCKNSGKLLKGSDIICPNGGCDDATCCEAKGVCKGMVNCQPGLTSPVLDYDSKSCDTNPCTNSDCCAPNPQCTTGFQCGPGYTYDTSKTGATCEGSMCEVSDCCELNQNCVDFVAKNTCGQGETPKDPLSAEPCKGLECEENECCNLDPTCIKQKFKCEDTFYKYKKLRPDASSYHCATMTCTEKDCCIITPTYNEPKVQTFPLESNYS